MKFKDVYLLLDDNHKNSGQGFTNIWPHGVQRTKEGCSCRNFCSWMTASTTKDNGFTTFELMKLKELKEKWKILAGNSYSTRERSRVENKNLCKIIHLKSMLPAKITCREMLRQKWSDKQKSSLQAFSGTLLLKVYLSLSNYDWKDAGEFLVILWQRLKLAANFGSSCIQKLMHEIRKQIYVSSKKLFSSLGMCLLSRFDIC